MKSVRSMPALAAVDSNRPVPLRRPIIRSHSMISAQPEVAIKKVIRAMPFMALPGMGSQLQSLQRSISKNHFASMSSSRLGTPREPDEFDTLLPQFLTPPKYTLPLMLAVISSILSSFQNGLNSSLLNVPESVIRRSLHLSEMQWSVIVSIFCIGGLIGSTMGGRLADRLGRKNLITSTNVLFIAGALFQALAQDVSMLIVGRVLIGCGCGISSVVIPLYLGEISPAELRGSVGAMNQFAIVIGILVANLLGKYGADPTSKFAWRYLLGSVLVPSLLQLCFSASLLESPLWLICNADPRGNVAKSVAAAEEVLVKLRGSEDVEFELEGFQAEKEKNLYDNELSMFSALSQKSVQRALVVGVGLMLAQQFSGINGVFFYSTNFFTKAHISSPWLGSVMAAAVNVLATGVAIPLMDRAGRRVLLLISSIGMCLSCMALTVALHYQSESIDDSVWLSVLSVASVLIYVCFFELGLGPISFLVSAEIYPASFRATGMAIAAVVNWSSNFFISLTFPHLNNVLAEYTFVPFAVILFFTSAFIWFLVPETRGRSLDQIQRLLVGGQISDLDDEGLGEDLDYDSDASYSSGHGFSGYSISYGAVDDPDLVSPHSSMLSSSFMQTPKEKRSAHFEQ